jgi:hypothetical protein
MDGWAMERPVMEKETVRARKQARTTQLADAARDAEASALPAAVRAQSSGQSPRKRPAQDKQRASVAKPLGTRSNSAARLRLQPKPAAGVDIVSDIPVVDLTAPGILASFDDQSAFESFLRRAVDAAAQGGTDESIDDIADGQACPVGASAEQRTAKVPAIEQGEHVSVVAAVGPLLPIDADRRLHLVSLDRPNRTPRRISLVSLAGVVSVWLGKAYSNVKWRHAQPARKQMRVLETLSLGGRKQMMLVSCGGERFLLATGAEVIHSLVRLQPETDEAVLPLGLSAR